MRDEKEVRSLTPQQLPSTAPEETRCLIQDVIKTFKNKFNVFWMKSDQVHVLLLSTVPLFSGEFTEQEDKFFSDNDVALDSSWRHDVMC